MSAQATLDFERHYPATPGVKCELDTTRHAAEDADSDAGYLRKHCMAALAGGDFTADEIAARLGRSILSIRPRISELRALGKVVPTSDRRRNDSGKMAVVWRAVL